MDSIQNLDILLHSPLRCGVWLGTPQPSSDTRVPAHNGVPAHPHPSSSNLGDFSGAADEMFQEHRWSVGTCQMNNLELNQCYSPASRRWWVLATTIGISSYSSWTKFMFLIDSIWKLLMGTKIIFLTCKKPCSANIAYHIDLLFPSRPVNGINTYQDMSVQKHLKSFHWGTGKQTIPRYWHTAHLYRLQGRPHIHLHLFRNRMWIKVITSMLNMNKSEKIWTFQWGFFRIKYKITAVYVAWQNPEYLGFPMRVSQNNHRNPLMIRNNTHYYLAFLHILKSNSKVTKKGGAFKNYINFHTHCGPDFWSKCTKKNKGKCTMRLCIIPMRLSYVVFFMFF